MSAETQFIVVVESGLSGNSYGAKITTSALLSEREGLDLLAAIARGESTELYTPHKKGTTVRVSERQLLDISGSRATPTKQTRITLAEVVSERA